MESFKSRSKIAVLMQKGKAQARVQSGYFAISLAGGPPFAQRFRRFGTSKVPIAKQIMRGGVLWIRAQRRFQGQPVVVGARKYIQRRQPRRFFIVPGRGFTRLFSTKTAKVNNQGIALRESHPRLAPVGVDGRVVA